MNKIFYTKIFEEIQDQELNTQDQDQELNTQDQDQEATTSPENMIIKFQKYILFIKLKDLQYKMSLVKNENLEFIESLKLLNLVLDSFDLFKYDQAFTLSNFLIDKISKYNLEKIKK